MAAIAATLILFFAGDGAGEDDVRTWRDGKGGVHVTITGEAADDTPAAPAGASADDRFSTETSLRRRELERALVEAAEKLARKRDEINRAERATYLVDAVPTPAESEEQQRWTDLRRNALLASTSFEEEKRRRLFALRREERGVLREIRDLWTAVDRLRSEVRAYYGKLPPWWIDRVRCAGCPAAAEIDEFLAKNELEIAGKAEPTPTATPGQ